MIQSEVLRGLQDAVKEAVAASAKPALPVAFVGVAFTKPADGKYLEVVNLVGSGGWEAWGDEKLHVGSMRLILHWPIGAPYEPVQLLESIAGHFSKGRYFPAFKVSAVPSYAGVIANGTENLYPATVRYERFN